MRPSLPPFSRLSGDGTMAAVDFDGWQGILDLASAHFSPLPVPHGGKLTALSPDGSLCVVAGFDWVAVLRTASPQSYLASASSPAPVKRVAVGDNGLVVAATVVDDDQASLCAWQGESLSPLFADEGESLGWARINTLELDATRGLVALWGSTGPEGSGSDEVWLFEVSDAGIRVRYEAHADLPIADLNGLLFPLLAGDFGLYDRERLMLLAPPANSGEMPAQHAVFPFRRLAGTAWSPNGTLVAWLWNTWDGTRDSYHLSVGSLVSGTVTDAAVEAVGHAPSVAVDNAGTATLLYGASPAILTVRRFAGGELVHQADLHLQPIARSGQS